MNNEYKIPNSNNLCLIIIVVIVIICLNVGAFFFIKNNSLLNGNTSTAENVENDDGSNATAKNDFIVAYKMESYNVSGSKGGTFNNKRNIVTIFSYNNSAIATKIQNSVNSISDNYWSDIKRETDELKNETVYTGLGANFLITTGAIRNNSISFSFTEDGSFGGVNWDNEIVINYDLNTGKVLSLSDISSNGLKDYLVKECIRKLENDSNNKNDLMEDYKSIIPNIIDKSWVFTNDGISIVFEKYSIADGAAGIITIDFTKNQVNSYLSSDFKF